MLFTNTTFAPLKITAEQKLEAYSGPDVFSVHRERKIDKETFVQTHLAGRFNAQ